MVVRNRDGDVIVTKFQCELAAAKEFLVVPAFEVRISDHAREPLRDQEDVIATFALIVWKVLIA